MLLGYARISTKDQNLDLQVDALNKAVLLTIKVFETLIDQIKKAFIGKTSIFAFFIFQIVKELNMKHIILLDFKPY